ncbi:MAG: flagellin [Rhodospirillales bacterium]|nr:flagellin [Rhodospirillales bacterium]MDE2198502.1 flagellin [Rhodospirillales bacterium]MDE2573708.1 flagellin [Rhodospirillales bacterium]
MSLNSVNTNMSAAIALQSLNMTSAALQATQKQISTGYRVADATDDGAAYAVAQRVRSDVGALTSANQQLGNVQGLLSTTISGLNNVSTEMNTARDVLVKLADSTVQGTTRSQYIQQYQSDVANIKTFFEDSKYNGKTLIGNIGGATGFGAVNVIRNEVGATYHIGTMSGSAFMASINFTSTQLNGAGTVAGLIGTAASATFMNKLNAVGTNLNTYGAATNYVNNQVTFNSNKIDALNNGLGALIDANLAQESATLQSLQIRQQLGTQALSIANQAPQSLLSLFK